MLTENHDSQLLLTTFTAFICLLIPLYMDICGE